VFKTLPWTAVLEIGVMSEAIAVAVRATLTGAQHQPIVSLKPEWYY